ncbi:MAG: hypothetical protein EOM03_14940 [Clostridia bacterium]|nr:hypothetical protein [Clostridia bacterium]
MKQAFQIQADQTLGNTITLTAAETAPFDYTFVAPPKCAPNMVVLWTGGSWQIVSSESTVQTLIAQSRREAAQQRARVLIDAVDFERFERIAQGKLHVFPDGLAGTVQLRHERDIINVNAVGSAAMMMISAGDTETKMEFRDQEDVTHQMTAHEMLAMAQDVMGWISSQYAAA